MIKIQELTSSDRQWIEETSTRLWGSPFVIVHETTYYPDTLPGFYALDNNTRCGLITYHIADNACEIVTLNSDYPGKGIGSALIEAVIHQASIAGCHRIWLITTNDNLHALGFYQKRGFELVTIHRHAVNRARKIKPQIPLLGENGIPIRDEIELEYPLYQP